MNSPWLASMRQMVPVALAFLAASAIAQTTTTVSTSTGTLTTTPTAAPAWRPGVYEASFADDLRENLAAKPAAFAELADSGPGFVPTARAIPGPAGRQPAGSLTGRLVFASAGHGWTWDTTTSLWYTQRPVTHGMVEDFGNLDQMALFVDACWRAGATVVPLRPVGHQSAERVVDNMSKDARFQGAWADSTSTLYFGGRGDRVPYRFAIASREETAVARYGPFFPKTDFYPVYAWARDGADRVTQTYRVVHTGGATEVRVNHRRVGKGWVYLGEFRFARGRGGYVEIVNRVDDPYEADGRHVVIADAVRFGNGLGDVNRGGGISGHPREEEASRYWVERSLAAAAAPIFDAVEDASDQNNNVGTPPRMSAHMNREKDGSFYDRIFLSFHSNAVGGRGVVGLFNQDADMRPDHQLEWARIVAKAINDEMTAPGRRWPLPWHLAAKDTDSHINFGELRRDYNNNEMAATIAEVAFHDRAEDAVFLRSPEGREAFARASLKAVLTYFHSFDPSRPAMTLPPAAPTLMSAVAEAPGKARIAWEPPPADPMLGGAPESYRVQVSTDGHGFDGGRPVRGATTFTVDSLATSPAHFFRVTAVNAGGESGPSQVLGVAFADAGRPSVSVVSAVGGLTDNQVCTQTAGGGLGGPLGPGGEFVRVIPRLMNPGNQAALVGLALAQGGYAFDSFRAEAWEPASASAPYQLAVVMCGRRTAGEGAVGDMLRGRLGAWVASGRALLLSGSNVAAALDGPSTATARESRSLAHGMLGVRFVADEATGTREREAWGFTVRPLARGGLPTTAVLAAQAGVDGLATRVSADAIAATDDALPLMEYEGGGVAATFHRASAGNGAVAVFGFPIEMAAGSPGFADVLSLLGRGLGVPPDRVRREGVAAAVSVPGAERPRPGARRPADRPVRPQRGGRNR